VPFFGDKEPYLKQFWSSKTTPNKIYAIDNYSQGFESYAHQIFNGVNQFLENEWDFNFSTTVHIVLAKSTEDLGYIIPTNITQKEAQKLIDSICDSKGVRGLAFGPVLLICLTGDKNLDTSMLKIVLAHEIFHSVQTELSGLGVKNISYENKVKKHGPSWMLEGCAGAFAASYEVNNTNNGSTKLYNEFQKLKSSTYQLSYEEYTNFQINLSENYTRLIYDSEIFCYDLMKKHGNNSIIEFYENIRHSTSDWQTQFESIFDITPHAFISGFRQIEITN